jgi:integrase
MPIPEWPAIDQAAWIATLRPGDPRGPCGLAAGWGPTSCRLVEKGYGRWLTWLVERRLLDSELAPGARVSRDNVAAYTADLQIVNRGYTIANRIQELGNAMRAMAPETDWTWLLRDANRLRSQTIPARKPPAPSRPTKPPVDAARRCMPVGEWPAIDQAAWIAALRPGDPLDPGGLAARWAAESCRKIENGYGRWLTWLAGRNQLDPELAPGARINRDNVAAYIADLGAINHGYTIQGRVQELGRAMRAMAPESEWGWLLRGADRLRSQTVPARDKRARLRSPEELVALGEQLMGEADAGDATLASAVRYRSGLVIAFLAYRPNRARNLTMMALGQHLVRRNDGWSLAFAATETKTGQPLDHTFPTALEPRLERYLAVYRPILLTRGGRQPAAPITALWVSQNATAMIYDSIAYWVCRNTREAFGVALSPHLFRDCAATSIAIVDPDHVRIAAGILGHSNLSTTEKHYNQARGLEAGRRYQGTIAAIRKDSGKRAAARSDAPSALRCQRRDGLNGPVADPVLEA